MYPKNGKLMCVCMCVCVCVCVFVFVFVVLRIGKVWEVNVNLKSML